MPELAQRARRRSVSVATVLAALATLAAMLPDALAQAPPNDPFWRQGQPAPPQPAAPATPAPAAPRPAAPASAPAARVIARIDGRPITQLDFDRVAEPYFQTVRAQLGGNLSGEMLRMANFNVFDELLRRELLSIEAQRQKLEPTQSDIDEILMQDPSFQTNGKFDPAKLEMFKTSPSTNYQTVLPRLRQLATMRKLDGQLRKRFTPPASQLRAEWNKRNDQVRFKSLALLTRDLSIEPEASEAEVAAYYAAHTDQFMRRSRLHLRYARLPIPPPGDSARARVEAGALEHGRAIADSLRRGLLPDSGGSLLDSGPFEVPPASIPGVGRVGGLADTLMRAETDLAIRVVGPYPWRDAVYVGVVAGREPKRLPPLGEVRGDAKRRADVEKRRTSAETERRAWWEAHRDRWRTTRIQLTRLVLNTDRLTVQPEPLDIVRWYALNGRSLQEPADSVQKPLPPLNDSLRAVVREHLARELRPRHAADIMGRVAAAFGSTRDAQALARANGASAETLSFVRPAAYDSLFGAQFVDSLLTTGLAIRGKVQGPRAFSNWWIVWRVDAVDTAFVLPYETARGRSDAAFAEERRKQDEAEGRTYFAQHHAGYLTPEKFGLDYVSVPVMNADSVKVPEAALRHEYEANAAKYRQEEQVRARHILFMTRDAGPDVDRVARQRADSLLAAIRKDGGDFGELAKRFSQEPGASNSGGELGWFGRNRMVKEFETAAFALKPGEISGVVKTQFGYHIIQCEEHKAAGAKPFDEVRAGIRLALAQSRADSSAQKAAESLRRRLALGGDPKALAAPLGGVVQAVPAPVTEPLPKFGFVPGLVKDMPTLVPGKWAPAIYHAGNTYLVLRLREKVAPQPATFDDVKTQVIEDVKNDKRRAVMDRKVAVIRSGLAAGATLDSLAAEYGGLKDSGFLTQSAGFVPGIGNEPRVVERAFAVPAGKTTDSLQIANGVLWLRVDERKAADDAAFKLAAPQLESEILKKKYDEWMDERKKTVRIEILRADLKGPRPGLPRSG